MLIEVKAAGVNRPDILQRQGLYPMPEGVTPVPGLEVAGVVVKVGAQVTAFTPGDRVCALTNGGGYAEYCAVPAGQTLPIPAGLSFSEAAAIPETFFTVWANVFQLGKLQPGEAFWSTAAPADWHHRGPAVPRAGDDRLCHRRPGRKNCCATSLC